MRSVNYIDKGLIDYKQCWDDQEVLFKASIQQKIDNRDGKSDETPPNHLIFCEHPHVYTLGKSGKESHLLMNQTQLEANKISYHKINRGGDITYHGPGQIVGYPILDLENFFTDIHKYLRLLEETIILTIAEYGLKGVRSDGETGVWLDVGTPFARKICALGVRTSRWVTMHGFALNVNTNLGYFDHIIPCGIRGKAVTSMQAVLNRKIPVKEVKALIQENFEKVFGAKLTNDVKI